MTPRDTSGDRVASFAMLVRLLAVTAFVLAGASAAHAQKAATFDHGGAVVVLPATFVTTERNDGTLRANFGPDGDHRLEIAIRDVQGKAGATDAGMQHVRAEAGARKLRVFEYPERVVYMQPAADQEIDGKQMHAATWYVGFGNHVAVLTLVAPATPTPELQRFLAKGLDEAVATVRRTTRRPPPG